jgi:hypothetical protein
MQFAMRFMATRLVASGLAFSCGATMRLFIAKPA